MAAKRKGKTISGIWVPVELDTSRITLNMREVNKEIGSVVTNLQSAFKVPAGAEKLGSLFDTSKLIKGVVEATKAVGSLRDGIEALSIIKTGGIQSALAGVSSELSDMGKAAGMTQSAVAGLIEKISQTQAVQSQVDALNKLGKAAGYTNQELYDMAKQVGVSAEAMQKLSGYAGSVDDLSNSVKEGSSNLEFYKQRLIEVNAVSSDVSKLEMWAKRLDLTGDAINTLARDLGISEAAVAKFRTGEKSASDATEMLKLKIQTLATTVGAAETIFSDLYEKASKVQAINQQAEAFNSLGNAVGMSANELLAFAKNLGATPDVMQKIRGYEGSVEDLTNSLKVSGTELEKYKKRLQDTNAVADDVSKLQKWSQKLNLNQKEVKQLAKDLGIAEKSLLAFTEAEKKAASAGRGLSGIFTPSSLSAGTQSALSAFGVSLGMFGAAELGKASFESELRLDSIKTAFEAIKGSTTEANIALGQIRETSNRLGLSFYDTAESAKQLFAAAQNSELKNNAMEIFEAFSSAGVALKLTGDQMNSVFLAVSQMISKGKVSAEELRLQLAERFPGAVSLFAQSIGKTTKELDEMLQKGEVGLDALIKFAARVQEEYGEKAAAASKSLQSELNRLTTSWDDLKSSFVDTKLASSAIKGIRDVIDGVGSSLEFIKGYGDELKAATTAVSIFAASYLVLGKNVMTSTSLIAAGGTVLEAFTLKIGAARKAITALMVALSSNPVLLLITVLSAGIAALTYFKDKTDDVAKAQKALDEANKNVTKSFENFSSKTKDNTDALKVYVNNLEAAKKAQDDLNKSTDKPFKKTYAPEEISYGGVLGISGAELNKFTKSGEAVKTFYDEIKDLNDEVLKTRDFTNYIVKIDDLGKRAESAGEYTDRLRKIVENLRSEAQKKIELGFDQEKLAEQIRIAEEQLKSLTDPLYIARIRVEVEEKAAAKRIEEIGAEYTKNAPEGKIEELNKKLQALKQTRDDLTSGRMLGVHDWDTQLNKIDSLIQKTNSDIAKLQAQTSSGQAAKAIREAQASARNASETIDELTGKSSTYELALVRAQEKRREALSKLDNDLKTSTMTEEDQLKVKEETIAAINKQYDANVALADAQKRRSDQTAADTAARKQAAEAERVAEAYRNINNELRETIEGNEALKIEIAGVTSETTKLDMKERAIATWREQQNQKILTQIDNWKKKNVDANTISRLQTELTLKADLEAQKKRNELAVERATLDEKNATLRMDFENEYANMVGVTSEGLKKSIQDRYNAWNKAGVDTVRLEEWKNDQILRSNKDAVSGIIVAYKDYANKTNDQAKQMGAIWGNFASGIDASFSTAFEELLFGGENAAEQLKSLFKKTLAQMVYTAAIQPIVVQMTGVLTGGVTGAISSLLGGGGAGGGGNAVSNLGALSNLLPSSWTSGASGLFSGITGGVNSFAANLLPDVFAPTTQFAANNALASQTLGYSLGPQTTLLGTLGAAGAGFGLGSLAGSLLFPDKPNISTGAGIGGGIGAAIGSIVPGIGTLLGGTVGSVLGGGIGSLFGGKKTHASVYGHMMDQGYTRDAQTYIDAFMSQATYDRAGASEAMAYAKPIAEAASQTAGNILDLAAMLPEEYRKKVEENLESATWSAGRGFSGASWNLQNWKEGMAEERIQEAINDMFEQMGYGANKAFSEAGIGEIFDTFDLSTEEGFAKVTKAVSSINAITSAIKEIQDPSTEAEKQAQAFIDQMNALSDAVKSSGVNAEYADKLIEEYRSAYVDNYVKSLEEMFNPLSQIEQQAKSYKESIDGYVSALTTMGASEEQLAKIRGYTQTAINNIIASLNDSISPLSSIQKETNANMKSILEYKAALETLGASTEELTVIDAAWGKMQRDLVAQFDEYTNAIPDVISSTRSTLENIIDLRDALASTGEVTLANVKADQAWSKVQSDLINKTRAYLDTTSEIVKQTDSINKEFDDLKQALIETGVATSVIEELERNRVQALAAMREEYTRSFNQSIEQRYAAMNDTSDEVSRAISQENELREAIKKFGSASDEVAKLMQLHAAENVYAAQQMVDSLTQQLNELKKRALQLQIQELTEQANAARETKNAWESVVDTLRGTRLKMWTGSENALGIFSQRDTAQAEFDRLYKLTMEGDKDAAKELASSGSTLLDLLKKTSSSSEEYLSSFWEIEQKLKDTQSYAEKEFSTAEKALEALQKQLDSQQAILDALNKEGESLEAINAQIAEVGQKLADALSKLSIAQNNQSSVNTSTSKTWEERLLEKKTESLNRGEYLTEGAPTEWTADMAKQAMIDTYGSVRAWYDKVGKYEGFASGGITPANKPFWVGEEGPELVVSPHQLGVVNNAASMNLVQQPKADNSEQIKLLKEQNDLLRQLLVESRKTVSNTDKTQNALETQNRVGIRVSK